MHFFWLGMVGLWCVLGAEARAEKSASVEERLQRLEQGQEDMFQQVLDRRGQVRSFLGEDISLGGFFESGIVAMGGGGSTRFQASASNHTLGINLAAEFSENIRFNSQIMAGLGFPILNANNNPRAVLLGFPIRRRFGTAAASILVAQGYVEYSTNPIFVMQAGLGYAPFGIAFQQRDPVLFRRRGGPQLIGGIAADAMAMAAPLWMGLHLSGSLETLSGRGGYNLYSFTPTSNTRTPGGGARIWLAPFSEALAVGFSTQVGKRNQTTFKTIGTDLRWKYRRFALTMEYVRNYTKFFNPWSAYLEPEVSVMEGKLLFYGALDYFNNTKGAVILSSTTAIADPYKQLRYGGGVNLLPSPHTRFRLGYLWYDYLGATERVLGQGRDFYTVDASVGVAF